MPIRVLAVGKKHELWVQDGIERYEKRLQKPFDTEWVLIPHSAREGMAAREEESMRLLARLNNDSYVVLLDERGTPLTSPQVAKALAKPLGYSRAVTLIIGGAYGVDERLQQRADLVWSLSPLVFPHQLVRLILTEQLYRAQEIARGGSYHHE